MNDGSGDDEEGSDEINEIRVNKNERKDVNNEEIKRKQKGDERCKQELRKWVKVDRSKRVHQQ